MFIDGINPDSGYWALSCWRDKAHARRRYVELTETFPVEVRFVLETLREVYITDARARDRGLDPTQRLALHQAESTAPMKALEQWMQRQFDERLIEPNSALGAAILYMRKRWSELTLFLRVEGAPLDNNTSERALKKAILHRNWVRLADRSGSAQRKAYFRIAA